MSVEAWILGLTAPMVAFAAWVVLARGPRRKLASLDVRPGEPFRLRARLAGRARVWLRYELAYGPVEDEWAVDGAVAVAVDGAARWSDAVRLRHGEEATGQPRRFGEGGSFYGVGTWEGRESRGTAGATVYLGAVDAPDAGGDVEVSGSLAAGPRTETRALTIFLSR